jgi:glycosyltransferase involved in cell wall biosynthesis
MVSMRGGEKFLVQLKALFPEAPIYTLLAYPERLDAALTQPVIVTSWLQRFGFVPNVHRLALPLLMPAARSLDARRHDVVICSDAATIKAIRTRPDALKICYCHSPARYAWDLHDQYVQSAGPIGRLALRTWAPRVRAADYAAAQSVSAFVANSHCVAERIRRNYGQPSVVIPPPVDTDFPEPLEADDGFYLVVSELVGYKRTDLAVQACVRMDRPLIVIGTGTELPKLKRLAGRGVQFLGWQSDEVVRDHMRRCRALLFCGEEDFGMVPVEAQAAGRPVIAYGRGGALETVIDGQTGVHFHEATAESVIGAIKRFESPNCLLPPAVIQGHARRFSVPAFRERFQSFYAWCVGVWREGGNVGVQEEMGKIPPYAFMKAAW